MRRNCQPGRSPSANAGQAPIRRIARGDSIAACCDDLPEPERPELAPLPTIRVLVDLIAGLLAFRPFRDTREGAMAGDPNPPVGETAAVTYIERSDAGESTTSAPAGTDREGTRNRAA